jgi:hypothetical protein
LTAHHLAVVGSSERIDRTPLLSNTVAFFADSRKDFAPTSPCAAHQADEDRRSHSAVPGTHDQSGPSNPLGAVVPLAVESDSRRDDHAPTKAYQMRRMAMLGRR